MKHPTLIIGAGGAGRSLAEALNNRIHADVLLVNAASAWQRRPAEFPTIELTPGAEAMSFHSVRHARKAVAAARVELQDALDKRTTIIIAAGLGGATGSAVAPYVAELARQRGLMVVAAVTTPFEFEGERVFEACGSLTELHKHCSVVCVYGHQRSLQARGQSSLTDALDHGAEILVSEVASQLREQGVCAEVLN